MDGPTSSIELVREMWMTNGCVKFEESSSNPSKVIALAMKTGGGDDKTIISLKTSFLRNTNYSCYIDKHD